MEIPKPGICYVLFCFRNSDYVAFLLASMFRSEDIFLIHVDQKAPIHLKLYIDAVSAKYSNILRIGSRDYSWAGYSHVKISIETAAIALQLPMKWTHLIFLSEQHLPLKSPSYIAAYRKRCFEALRTRA